VTIIMRSALVFHGHEVPDDLALVECKYPGHRRIVTWHELHARRRDRQAWILERKRYCEPLRAVRLLVAFFDQTFYAGWHAFIEDAYGHSHWINRSSSSMPPIDLFPVCLPLGSASEQWQLWMPAFAETHRRGTHHGRPRGVAFLWRRGFKLSHVAADLAVER